MLFSLEEQSLRCNNIPILVTCTELFSSLVEFVHLHSTIFMELDICTNTSKVRLVDLWGILVLLQLILQ